MPRDQAPADPPAPPAVVGIPAALAALRLTDPDAQVLWKCKGPRNTNSELAGILFKAAAGVGRIIVIVHAQERGSYSLFFEGLLPIAKEGGDAE